MTNNHWPMRAGFALLLAVGLAASLALCVAAKEKAQVPSVDPNDPTLRLFQTIDNSREGKLSDFYVIADVYKDPDSPNEEYQHILKADYDRSRIFGKLQLIVRSVGKIHPDQMKTYTPKDFYEFGLSDLEKYIKSEPGSFGRSGDVYLKAGSERPLTSAPVTDDVRKNYELLVTQHLLPAVEKK
jgi:hypothetical protein